MDLKFLLTDTEGVTVSTGVEDPEVYSIAVHAHCRGDDYSSHYRRASRSLNIPYHRDEHGWVLVTGAQIAHWVEDPAETDGA